MQDRYSLERGRARAVRLLALVFLLLGVHRTATLALPLVAPAYMAMSFDLEDGQFTIGPDPYWLLPPELRSDVERVGPAHTRFEARLEKWAVRWRLLLIELVGRLPELALMYCVGIALWRSSRAGVDAALSAVPWLLRAAAAGAAMAIVTPVAEAFRTGLLLDGVIPAPTLFFHIDFDEVERNLLFAGAAWAATWAIASGLRARADLAEIV